MKFDPLDFPGKERICWWLAALWASALLAVAIRAWLDGAA